MDTATDYFRYLRGRSLLGHLYRKALLYPRLNRYLAGRVLDYGCGIGDFLRFRSNTVGVDTNPHIIDYCLSLGLDAVLIPANGAIPFPDESFSGVVIDNVLEHLAQDHVGFVLDEIGRVLEPGAVVVVGVPGTKGYHSDDDHKVFYSQGALAELFVGRGYLLELVFSMPFRSRLLDRKLRAYCIYAVFRRPSMRTA